MIMLCDVVYTVSVFSLWEDVNVVD
ncbi:hypothetical protein Pint_19114 [Pistacia integerrima]|uniref:Uncharacterized protein n=1 Tax=Pistacia integerrima TaxID=434235 RepID=A0ACC0YZG5_9ROSI|nr:hypothetical protein Pint_19114 [Pistacia integerrima]